MAPADEGVVPTVAAFEVRLGALPMPIRARVVVVVARVAVLVDEVVPLCPACMLKPRGALESTCLLPEAPVGSSH